MTFLEGLAEALCVSDGKQWPPSQEDWDFYVSKAQTIAEHLQVREEACIVSDSPWTEKRRMVISESLYDQLNSDETVPGDRIEYRYVTDWRQW